MELVEFTKSGDQIDLENSIDKHAVNIFLAAVKMGASVLYFGCTADLVFFNEQR